MQTHAVWLNGENYARLKKQGRKFKVTILENILEYLKAPHSYSFFWQLQKGIDCFQGWKPECGEGAMVRTTLQLPEDYWQWLWRYFPGKQKLMMFLNELLEDVTLTPARRAEKLAYWRNGGKKVKQQEAAVQTTAKLCQKCSDLEAKFRELHNLYSDLHAKSSALVRWVTANYMDEAFRNEETKIIINSIYDHYPQNDCWRV